MRNKLRTVCMCSILCLATLFVLDISFDIIENGSGTIIYVNKTGGGGAYTRIQDAINAAIDGDTVFVYNGTYIENVIINKRINLIGEDKNITIINGFGDDDVVHIVVDSVNITGFSIRNTAWYAGIELLNVNRCYISNNILFGNHFGIELFYSNETFIVNNLLSNNNNGIYLSGSNWNTIIGNNVSSSFWGCGIWLYLSNGNNILDNHVSPYMDYPIILDTSHQNNIVNNNVSTNTDYGIYIYSSNENNVTNNNASNCDYGIYLGYSDKTNITGNNASNCLYGIWLSYSNITKIIENNLFLNGIGICIEDSNHNNITNNNASNNNGGIYLGYSSSSKIISNILFDNECGVLLELSSENEIIDNTMTSGGFFIYRGNIEHWNTHNIPTSNTLNGKPIYYWKNQTGGKIPSDAAQVILANCSKVIVEDLDLTNGSVGIELGFSQMNNIKHNNFSSNYYYGMYIHNSSKNNITKNNASNNRLHGIYLSGSNANNISNNEVSSNGWNGIYLQFSSANTIFTNNMSLNTYSGIAASNSYWNNITNNTISNNKYGISLGSSTNNSIYHNNIVTNTYQAYDYTINGNLWDNGYPSGGNFWSDYIGEDRFNGPSQDIPGNDGIGDTNYSIDKDSVDNYPLMFPIGNYIFLYQRWNLISIPLIQSDTNLSSIFKPIEGLWDTIWGYNTCDNQDQWKLNNTSKLQSMNDLDNMNHTIGIWIHITDPNGTLFQYQGTQPTMNQTITLYPGWNLVGYPSLIDRTRDNALNNIIFGGDVDAIWTFNAATKKWQVIGPTDSFQLGRGYWIHSKVTKTWDVPL